MHELTWAEYARNHAPVHDSIFSGRDAHEGPFADGGWPCVPLVGGLSMDEETFSALAGAAGAQGDDRFVVTYRATVFEQDPPVEAPWTPAALEAVRCGTPFGHVDADVFGASGTWGLLASCEHFAVLGGTPGFMADFLARVEGGEARLRRDFADALRGGMIGFGEGGLRYGEMLMRAHGWMQGR